MIFQFGEQCRESLSIDETRRDERASREDKGEDGERKMRPPPLSAKEELQRVTSRVWYVTDPDKPRPREHAAKGARPCCAALEKRKRKLGVHVKIYSYESRFCLLTILMDSQVSKSYVLKQRFLILFLTSPCSASLSLSLSLSHSDRQISSNKLFQLYTYFHIAMRSVIHGRACSCRAVLRL